MRADPITQDPWRTRSTAEADRELERGAARVNAELEQRRRVQVAALALIGLGSFFLLQQMFWFGPQLIVLAIGIGFYVAYTSQRGRSDLIIPAGILSGLGVGIALVSDNVTPGNIHGPIMLGALALGFGAIFFLGEARHRWAMWPAMVFAVLAGTVLATSDPFRFDPALSQVRLLWPLLLIGGGLWVLQRERWL